MAENIVKSITLKSSDGELFDVPEAVAVQSKTIRHLIEDDCAANSIPLANVNSRILAMILEYCTKHITGTEKAADSPTKAKAEEGSSTEMPEAISPEEELKQWDDNFLNIDKDTLFHLIMAANFLDIGDLLELTCQKVANMITGKNPDEIRKTFGIKNDFTPEEEEEIHRENEWAFK